MRTVEARTIAKVSEEHTGSYTGALLLLAAPGTPATGIVLMIGSEDALERVPAAAE